MGHALLGLLVAVGGCQTAAPAPGEQQYQVRDEPSYAPGRDGEVRTLTVTGPEGATFTFSYEILDEAEFFESVDEVGEHARDRRDAVRVPKRSMSERA